jgi:hypothetical protein
MKQKTVRRFQNIPIHAGCTEKVEYITRIFNKHKLPLLTDINTMMEFCELIQFYNKKQIDNLRTALDLDVYNKQTRVLNDKYSK